MSSSLQIENLANTVQVDGMGPLSPGSGQASEARALREMEVEGLKATQGPTGPDSPTFARALENSLAEVNQDQVQANEAIKELVAGRSKNIHETMLTIERADTSLKLAMQVRNKILDAYREIMRMQV